MGPLGEEANANGVWRLWSHCPRAPVERAARAEAISIYFDIPGYVDWEFVFGDRGELAKACRFQFLRNPCSSETSAVAVAGRGHLTPSGRKSTPTEKRQCVDDKPQKRKRKRRTADFEDDEMEMFMKKKRERPINK
jgi:hypothetical protein